MEKHINNSQKALVHLAAAQLGMDDDDYKNMLDDVAGVKSSQELTLRKFRDIMYELERRGFKKRPGKHNQNGFVQFLAKWAKAVGHKRPGMATPEQLARIETDWNEMRWYWAPDGFGNYQISLRGFLKSQTGVADLRFLGLGQAYNVIEAMKAIRKRGSACSE